MKYLITLIALLFATSLQAQQIDDWIYESDVDELTGVDSSLAKTYTDSGDSFIIARCLGGSLTFFSFSEEFLGVSDSFIQWKFDDGEVESYTASVLDNRIAIINSRSFKREILTASTVTIRFHDYKHVIVGTYTFSLRGSSDAIGLLNCVGI